MLGEIVIRRTGTYAEVEERQKRKTLEREKEGGLETWEKWKEKRGLEKLEKLREGLGDWDRRLGQRMEM